MPFEGLVGHTNAVRRGCYLAAVSVCGCRPYAYAFSRFWLLSAAFTLEHRPVTAGILERRLDDTSSDARLNYATTALLNMPR